jgi:hypothetical protein
MYYWQVPRRLRKADHERQLIVVWNNRQFIIGPYFTDDTANWVKQVQFPPNLLQVLLHWTSVCQWGSNTMAVLGRAFRYRWTGRGEQTHLICCKIWDNVSQRCVQASWNTSLASLHRRCWPSLRTSVVRRLATDGAVHSCTLKYDITRKVRRNGTRFNGLWVVIGLLYDFCGTERVKFCLKRCNWSSWLHKKTQNTNNLFHALYAPSKLCKFCLK